MKRIKKLLMAIVVCLTALCITSCGQPTENKPTDPPGNGTKPDEPKEINLHVDYTVDKEVTLKFVEFVRGVYEGKAYVEKVGDSGGQPNPVGERKIRLSEIENLNSKQTDYFNRSYTSITINDTEYAIIDDGFFQDEDCKQEALADFDTAYIKVQIITTHTFVEYDKDPEDDNTAKQTGTTFEIKTSYEPDLENIEKDIWYKWKKTPDIANYNKAGVIINNEPYIYVGRGYRFIDKNCTTKDNIFDKTYSTLYYRVMKLTGDYIPLDNPWD